MYCALILAAIFSGPLFADEQCALTFSGCPQAFDGDTLRVPNNVTKLYSMVHACNASQTIQVGGGGGTCSIIFVIDNTGSMKGSGGNDPTGARFTVTKALLDTIYAKEPQAEVGLVVFREHLFFDTTTTEYYTKYFKTLHPTLDNQPDQAYLPFMGLSQTYDGKQGIDIIKDILTTDATGGDLVYQPNWTEPTGGETNINGAFIGVKQAFQSAKNPKENQYVIFMSDGDPEGTNQANLDPHWFDTPAGCANMPTTFTVFFLKNNGAAPADLVTMTTNIQNNGYSTSNPKSNIWPLTNVNYTNLMTLLMNNVITNLLLSGNPSKMVLNGTTSTIYVDSSFFFADSFAIADTPTSVNMGITYRYVNPKTQILSDTVIAINFYIQRTQQTTLPAGVGEVCQQVTGPVGSIPVTATLLDNNHNGHLDEIDIKWTVDSTITGTPTVAQLIQSLVITTLDGKKDTLHAASIQMDLANNTIHIMLTENTGNVYETAWQPNPAISLTNYPMTGSGSWFVITAVIDGAAPVIKSVCFQPAPGGDSLHVEFSEPLLGKNPPVAGDTLHTPGGPLPMSAAGTVTPAPQGDMASYGFTNGKLSNSDSLIVEGNRPAFPLDPCGGVAIVSNYVVGPSPFNPRTTIVPPALRNPNGTSPTGTVIVVDINPAMAGHLQSNDITGTVTILDAVGNVVVEKTSMYTDVKVNNPPKMLIWAWDGKTRSGSWAAPGTYLARIVITDSKTGAKQSIHLNVGVRH
jgi:hypothetical protein